MIRSGHFELGLLLIGEEEAQSFADSAPSLFLVPFRRSSIGTSGD